MTRNTGREKICKCIWVERERERESKYTAEGRRHQNFSKLQLWSGSRVHLVISRQTSLTIAHTLGYLNKPLTLAIKRKSTQSHWKTCLWRHLQNHITLLLACFATLSKSNVLNGGQMSVVLNLHLDLNR